MEKDVKKYSIYSIAIVAIVAVVGIVVMTTNYGGFSGTSGTTSEDVLTSDEEGIETSESVGLAGQAYSVKGCTDLDAVSSKMTNDQFYLKTEVTDKKGLKKSDKCVTDKNGITSLYEAWCLPSGVSSYYVKKCNKLNTVGTDYNCVNGACVKIAPVSFCYYINNTGGNYYNKSWSTGTDYDYVITENGNFTKYCDGNLLLKPRCGTAGQGNIADKLVTNYDTYFIGGVGVSLGTPQMVTNCDSGCDINLKICNPAQNSNNQTTTNTTNTTCTINVIFSECQGDNLHKKTQNSCTQLINDTSIPCGIINFGWAPKTCKINNVGSPYCGTVDCKSGDMAYTCTNNGMGGNYNYYKTICETFSWGGQWKLISEFSSTCPVGATCYNPEGKCA